MKSIGKKLHRRGHGKINTPRYQKGPAVKYKETMASEKERETKSVPHENGGGGAVRSLPRHHHVSARG
jgi:hypothetical protein